MSSIAFVPIPTEHARQIWSGGLDANGMVPERKISDGQGVPCRHCLHPVAAGEAYLVLAYRPFEELQPYAETGPIFLHAEACAAYDDTGCLPPVCAGGESRIVRGYDSRDRIIYGTGKVVPAADIAAYAEALLTDSNVRYVHVRSSMNNCYAFRINRVGTAH